MQCLHALAGSKEDVADDSLDLLFPWQKKENVVPDLTMEGVAAILERMTAEGLNNG